MTIRKQPNGKWLCECYPNGRDGKRVRKAVARTKDAADLWLLSVQCEPLRILSMVYKPGEPMLSEYVTVEPTQAEALAGVKTYLLEAVWTQA